MFSFAFSSDKTHVSVAPTFVFVIRAIREWEWRIEATSLCRWTENNQDTPRHLVQYLTEGWQLKRRNRPELQSLKRKINVHIYVHQLSTHRSRYFTAQALQHCALLELLLLFIWIIVSGWHRNRQNYARLSWQSYRFPSVAYTKYYRLIIIIAVITNPFLHICKLNGVMILTYYD